MASDAIYFAYYISLYALTYLLCLLLLLVYFAYRINLYVFIFIFAILLLVLSDEFIKNSLSRDNDMVCIYFSLP